MSSPDSFIERRRAERVLIRIPIKIDAVRKDGKRFQETAETAVVSREGAMLRLRSPVKPGSTLELVNKLNEQAEKFRVVWVGEKPREGKYDVGVEMVVVREGFWGVGFPAPARKA